MDGGREELFLCWSQACVSQTPAPPRPSIWSRRRRLSNPHPIKRRRVRLKDETGSAKGEEAGQETRGRNGKQAVRADGKCTSEGRQEEARSEPGPRCEGLQTGCLSARAGRVWRGGWANPQGRRQTNPSSSFVVWLDLCGNFKNIRQK